MQPVILFRKDITTEPELEIARKYFQCVEYRSEIPKNSLVIPRYSALPYYRELEHDVEKLGSKLITTKRQHDYVANFVDYYEDLKDYTFETWTEAQYPYSGYDGPVVVKGRTNSRKHQWNSHFFAKDRKAAINVAAELANDQLLGPQGLIYRKYVPLKTFEVDFTGLPYSNEFRFFYYKQNLLSFGYYWSCASDTSLCSINGDGFDFVKKIAEIASQNIDFFVVDIAERISGEWILVELNCGTSSGLSMNDPETLYRNLRDVLRKIIRSNKK